LTSRAGSGAPGARDASLESASVERGGTSQRAREAAHTSHAEELAVRCEAGPGGPDLTSRAGSRAPGARDASLESAGVERDGTSQRAREAARTSLAEELTVHGEVRPGGPDLMSRAGSGAPGARDASLEGASLERGGTSQRAREAAHTSHAEEVTVHGEAWPGGPDLTNGVDGRVP
jgi:hypothetical protein